MIWDNIFTTTFYIIMGVLTYQSVYLITRVLSKKIDDLSKEIKFLYRYIDTLQDAKDAKRRMHTSMVITKLEEIERLIDGLKNKE